LTAIRRASSRVSRFAADCRPDSILEIDVSELWPIKPLKVWAGLWQRPLKTVGVIVKPRSTAISGPTNYCHKKEPRADLARGALEVCCLGTLGFWEAALVSGDIGGWVVLPGLTVIT
jgi:hypothetical protein